MEQQKTITATGPKDFDLLVNRELEALDNADNVKTIFEVIRYFNILPEGGLLCIACISYEVD